MNNEKNYLDGIKSPIQRKSIKDIPVPTRKKDRLNSSDLIIDRKPTARPASKKSLDLREESPRNEIEKEPISNFIRENRNSAPEKESAYSDDGGSGDDFDYSDERGNKKFPFFITAISLVVVIVIFIITTNFFYSAKINISPKVSELLNSSVDIPIIDEKSANADILNYKVLEISESASKIVDSENEEAVENKASGVITVYNEFNQTGQKLIQNTRFETKEGLIYRIKDSITVPGYTENNGQKTAGSIDVEVFADEAGEKFNIASADFKVPGFKDQEQYDFFYAKTKTELSGGFIGTKNTVSAEVLDANVKTLQAQITEKIIKKIDEQKTDNYIYVYTPESFTFLEAKQNNASSKKVEISQSGSAKIYVIEKAAFSKKIAEKSLRDYDGQPVLIEDLSKLNIKVNQNNTDEEMDEENSDEETISQNNIVLNVSGDSKIVWQNDLEALKKDLAGKNKKDLLEIISKYPGIVKANSTLNLFWKTAFPKNVNKINIEIEK